MGLSPHLIPLVPFEGFGFLVDDRDGTDPAEANDEIAYGSVLYVGGYNRVDRFGALDQVGQSVWIVLAEYKVRRVDTLMHNPTSITLLVTIIYGWLEAIQNGDLAAPVLLIDAINHTECRHKNTVEQCDSVSPTRP